MAYYGYSRLVLEGKQLEEYYDYNTFNQYIGTLGFPEMKVKPHNLPTNAFGMLPIAWLSPRNAKIAWTILSLILYLFSVTLLLKMNKLQLKDNLGIGIFAFALLWRPLYENIVMGQFYIALLFLFTLSIYALTKKQVALSSLPIVSTLLLKGNGIVPLLWFAFKRNWKITCSIILLLIVLVIISLPLFSLSTWNAYSTEIVSNLGRTPLDGHVAYQTVNGFLLHMFTFDEHWLPTPLIHLPNTIVFAMSLIVNLLLMILVFTYTAIFGKNQSYLSYSAVIALGVITAPISEEHAYILFLPLIIGLLTQIMNENKGRVTLNFFTFTFLLSIALLAVPIQYEKLQFAQAPLIFFAYPKLYAGLLILICYSFITRKVRFMQNFQ
ncbi:MAG: DUF2029 domain-containing protein [Ignavibacteriae bacterium]|nr:DUF2029 domain-containing protein [Ignavibacteriota bacterium]